MKIRVFCGDITTSTTEAIVNAANPSVLGGGGVDGAIHKAAGKALWKACRALPQLEPGVRCPVGEVVTTPGFDLKAKYILHTPGPIFESGRDLKFPGEAPSTDEDASILLASCIRNCLLKAEELGCRSIAFPAISCGVYGGSHAVFASLARGILREKVWNLDEVHFVMFSPEHLTAFKAGWAAFGAFLPDPPEKKVACSPKGRS